ncbi:hypothetical protein V5O48_010998 [Marasmius crinis-equi]|uniref:Uncharacterized protein n=1 Tax=Marasmius crinis-equi TaxID=585013 RepID=A0ABR3F754_9AGAR
MAKLQRFTSTMKAPVTEKDRRSQGFLELETNGNDFVFARNKKGSGKEIDDVMKSWSICMSDYTIKERQYLLELRNDILGADKEITACKPTKRGGQYLGGTRFERHWRAANLSGSPRAYPIGVTNQVQRSLEGPSKGSKRIGQPLDENGLLRYRLLKGGAMCVRKGLTKGPQELVQLLDDRSEFVNSARLGEDFNALCTAAQINIAAMACDEARERAQRGVDEGSVHTRAGTKRKRDEEEDELEEDSDEEDDYEHSDQDIDGETEADWKRRKLNDGSIKSLGKFGSNHADHGDSPAGPTACINLTRPHPDVDQEWFYVFDLGIAWQLEELCTIYFSGLHYHSGCETRYRTNDRAQRKDLRPYHRLTLIMYPSTGELEGTSATALAALPLDTRNRLLTVAVEMRNSSESHHPSNSSSCNSASYIADGLSLQEPRSYLNHTARDILSLAIWLVNQAPPEAALRIDRDKFLESFSMRIDDERIAAKQWQLGPGWFGKDVEIGRRYERLPADINLAELKRLRNSDHPTEIPYGNKRRIQHIERWNRHIERSSASIPLCVATAGRDPESGPSGSRTARKKTTNDSRRIPKQATKAKASDKIKKKKAPRHEGEEPYSASRTQLSPRLVQETCQRHPSRTVPAYVESLSLEALTSELQTLEELSDNGHTQVVSSLHGRIDGSGRANDLPALAALLSTLNE